MALIDDLETLLNAGTGLSLYERAVLKMAISFLDQPGKSI